MDTLSYEPFYSPNLTLLTCRTVNDEPVLGSPEMVHLLRTVLRELKGSIHFSLVAYAFLPTHIHLLTSQVGGESPERITKEMSSRYDREYQSLMGNPQPMTVWQKRTETQTLHDVETFATCLDAIHYDPVRHGLVQRPENWSDTSYEDWVERSLYRLGWGWTEPESIRKVKID